jgi:hypothetical protein
VPTVGWPFSDMLQAATMASPAAAARASKRFVFITI